MESIHTIFSTQQALEFHPHSVLCVSYDSHKNNHFNRTFLHLLYIFCCHGSTALVGLCLLIVDVSRSHTALGRTSLDEWSARRRDLDLATNNAHTRRISMLPARFEPAVLASERP